LSERFGLASAEAGAEDENAPGKINPQQQRHDPAKRPVNRIQGGEVSQIDHEETLTRPQENCGAQGGRPDFGKPRGPARRQPVKQAQTEEQHQHRNEKGSLAIHPGTEMTRWKEPTLRHPHQHRRRHAQEGRTRRDAEQRQAFQRQSPPIVNHSTPGSVGRADQAGEALEGGPEQDEKGDRARLPARFDHTGNGSKNLLLKFSTYRNVAFDVGNHHFPGPVPVHKKRGYRDEQEHQRKQREERIEGERSRPLCPVNPGELFEPETKYRPDPMRF
jgi:hypothetical protein